MPNDEGHFFQQPNNRATNKMLSKFIQTVPLSKMPFTLEINPSIHFVEMHRDCCVVAFVLNGKIDKDAERIYCEIKINVKSTICLRLGIAAKYSVGFYVDFSLS